MRELAWSGIPDYMRPDVWRLLLVSLSSLILAIGFKKHDDWKYWACNSKLLSLKSKFQTCNQMFLGVQLEILVSAESFQIGFNFFFFYQTDNENLFHRRC